VDSLLAKPWPYRPVFTIIRASGWIAALALALGMTAAPACADRPAPPLDIPLYNPPPASAAGVAPFVLPASGEARARALHCLTEAVYYEAATEPRAGQEAVAQVVLNRLKHPAFPKSVCGVVFEGAERLTGCQFTFTCDGSLARPPVQWLWDQAEQVAAAALGGHVAADVGASTHYHAAWMTPYWAASLIPTRRIGGHIFYRMPGWQGSPLALTGQYSGDEPAAPPALTASAGFYRVSNGARAQRAAAASPVKAVSHFRVWGLGVAVVSASHGVVIVRGGS
jgi:hypothetical protein